MSICRFKHIVSIAITITIIKKNEIDDSEIDEARVASTPYEMASNNGGIQLHSVTGIINE